MRHDRRDRKPFKGRRNDDNFHGQRRIRKFSKDQEDHSGRRRVNKKGGKFKPKNNFKRKNMDEKDLDQDIRNYWLKSGKKEG